MSKFTEQIERELMLSSIKDTFHLSRDEVVELMYSPDVKRDGHVLAVRFADIEIKNPGIAPG
jgi:hypothetical protein